MLNLPSVGNFFYKWWKIASQNLGNNYNVISQALPSDSHKIEIPLQNPINKPCLPFSGPFTDFNLHITYLIVPTIDERNSVDCKHPFNVSRMVFFGLII